MAKRASNKSKYPGMMDHIAAGGQPAAIVSLYDNAIKECYEEAGIPSEITKNYLQPVSAVSYIDYNEPTDCIVRIVYILVYYL